jgi:hypothetical protein
MFLYKKYKDIYRDNINMDHGEISILICDDCMDAMDMDDFQANARRVYIRSFIYYGSAVVTMVFMTALCIWSYIVVMEVDSMPDHE